MAVIGTRTTREIAARIHLLGRFEFRRGARTVTDAGWRLRKGRSLVKLLALAPERRLHREQIMAALWPDLEPAAAANNLYQALHAARRMLDEPGGKASLLQVRDEIVGLCPDQPVWIDVAAFEAAAVSARRERDLATYTRAIESYSGDLLPEDRYEEWATDRRQALRHEYLSLLLDLASLREAGGEVQQAIEVLQRAVRHDSTYEEAHRRLMWLYALTGNHHRARRQYQILKETLRGELDAEPDAITQELYREILDGRIPGITVPHAAAADSTNLLKTALDQTYADLPEPERLIFRRLSVFAGGFTPEAVAAICAKGVEKDRVAAIITRLLDRALIIADRHGPQVRYRMLEAIRNHVHSKMVEAGEIHHVRQRHCDWFLSVAERAEPELAGPDQTLWVSQLEADHDNLRAALEFCREHDPSTGPRLVAALWQFWEIHGYVVEGRRWADEILSRAGQDLAPSPRARVLLGGGALASRQGDRSNSRAMLEESLRLFREIGDQWGVAWALDNLGMIVLADGDYAQAQSMLDRSLALFHDAGDKRGTACVLDNLGWTALMRGEHGQARTRFEEALAAFREIGDRRGEGRALGNLANVLRIQGDLGQARALLAQSVEACRPAGPRPKSWFDAVRRSWLTRLQLGAWPGVLGPITLPCAGVCAGYPLIAASLKLTPALFTGLAVVHFVLLPLLLVVNAGLLTLGFLRHRHPLGLILGAVGIVFIFTALSEHVITYPWSLSRNWILHTLVYPGAALLLAGAIIDWRVKRRSI